MHRAPRVGGLYYLFFQSSSEAWTGAVEMASGSFATCRLVTPAPADWHPCGHIALSNFSKASLKIFTPSSRSLSVASFIEMPTRSSVSIVSCAPSISSFEARPRFPVIAKSVESRRRDRIDGVGANQLFDIDHITKARILRARARPGLALRLRPLFGQHVPARAAEEFLITLIGQLGVRDRDLSAS